MNCPKTSKPPFVCNGCHSRTGCRKNRFMYFAEDANREYKDKLSTSRQGINLNPEEFDKLNKIVKNGIERGLSFAMIINSNIKIYRFAKELYIVINKWII